MKKYLIIIGLLLFSCGIQEGTITKKWYEPSRIETIMVPHVIGKSVVSVPTVIKKSEHYCLEIQKGKKTNTIYVEKKEYEEWQIGNYYTKGK